MGADRDPALAALGAPGSAAFADWIVRSLSDAGKVAAGAGRTRVLEGDAKRIIDDALARYDGPCSQAYAEVLRAYICAPAGGRDALFLAMTDRVLGVIKPSPSLRSSEAPGDVAPAPQQQTDQAELLAWARLTLGLLSRPTRQERS